MSPQLKVPVKKGVIVSNKTPGYPPQMKSASIDGKLLLASTSRPFRSPPKNIDLSALKLKKGKRRILKRGWMEER